MKKFLASLSILLGLCPLAQAQLYPNGTGSNGYSGYLSNESALAYNKTYTIDFAPYLGNSIASIVTYGSATIANVSVTDGSESTGTITISNYAGLAAASAIARFTVGSSTGLGGSVVTIGNCRLVNGTDWVSGANRNAAATNLAAAIGGCSSLTASASGNIVYTTATAGSYANTWAFTSDNSSVTASFSRLWGGQDNATLTIGSTVLTQGTNFTAATSNAVTAKNLAAAINAAGIVLISTNNVGGTVVYATSTLNGTAYNYAMTSSTSASMTVNAPTMTGGADPKMTLGSAIFTVGSAHNLTTGLPVLFSSSTTGDTLGLPGLVNQTTYYAIPISTFKFELSRCSSCAVNGTDLLVVTSTQSQRSSLMHTYTLSVPAITGTPSFKWQGSNDSSSWFDLSVASQTIASYTYGNATGTWDFPQYDFRYLRLNAIAPTAGGLVLQTYVNIKNGVTWPR